MAKVVFGGGVSAISGKMGGTVYARNKGGAYTRNFAVPTNPSTVYQEEARDRLTQYSNEWRGLTEQQRLSWNEWANTHPILDRLGATKLLTGAQAYTKINTNRDLAGDATANATIPSDPEWVNLIIDTTAPVVAEIADGSILVTLGAGAAADQIVFVFATGPISPGISNYFNVERLIGAHTLTAEDITAGEFDIFDLWTSRFGPLTGNAGRKIGLHSYQYLQGQLGAAMQSVGIIAE
jgi:hypothetical protein